MPKLFRCIPVVGLLLALTGTSSHAQEGSPQAEETKRKVLDAVRDARKDHPNITVRINKMTGMPNSVTGLASPEGQRRKAGPGIGSSEVSQAEIKDAVRSFFKPGQIGASVSPTVLGTADYPIDETHGVRKDLDFGEQYVAKVTQQVDGIPVFGASAKVVVTTKSGFAEVTTSAPNFSPLDVKRVTRNPPVTKDQAIALAAAELKKQIEKATRSPGMQSLRAAQDATPAVQLFIFDPRLAGVKSENQQARLAWQISFGDVRIFIDAETRQTLFSYTDRHSSFLRHVYDLSEGKNFKVSSVKDAEIARANPDVKKAFDNVEIAYNFFRNVLERDSFDDQGGHIEAFTRYSNEENAYWCRAVTLDCPKKDVLVFGPGWPVLDIAAHEFSHGVIEYSAKLLYANESGAVNESLADIFGVLIKLEQGGSKWIIGDLLPGHSDTSPLRDMSNPHMNLFRKDQFVGGQPAAYDEVLAPSDPACAAFLWNDNGCVHLNSGILNRAAYLMSEGGQQGQAVVAGIGRKKLARLTYRILTHKLGETSTIVQTADAYRDACEELKLSQKSGFTAGDCKQVDSALNALHLAADS